MQGFITIYCVTIYSNCSKCKCIMDSDNIVYQKRKLRQFNLVSDIVISPKRSLIINNFFLKTIEITLLVQYLKLLNVITLCNHLCLNNYVIF